MRTPCRSSSAATIRTVDDLPFDPTTWIDAKRRCGMPSTVIVDRKGQVRFVHRGYKPGDENEYLNSIRELIRE